MRITHAALALSLKTKVAAAAVNAALEMLLKLKKTAAPPRLFRVLVDDEEYSANVVHAAALMMMLLQLTITEAESERCSCVYLQMTHVALCRLR